MMTYKHLSEGERETLSFMLATGKSLRQAAFYLNRSVSSLSRELKRNRPGKRYRAHLAHQKAIHRRHHTVRKKTLLSTHIQLRKQVIRMLKQKWSPEIIAAQLKPLHSETIYRWIYKYDKSLIKHLVRSHPQRRSRWNPPWPRRLIPGRVSVLERPEFINLRQVPGHWETDLLWGSQRAALQVLIERKTRFVQLKKIPRKSAQASYEALSSLFSNIKSSLRRSITYDNGAENALHLYLNQNFNMQSYFCQPYHAWEKGSVENTNGLIRRFLKKNTDLSRIPSSKIKKIETWLNNRPRKCLNFQTPAKAFRLAGCCTYT